MRRHAHFLCCLAVLVILPVSPAWGWGCMGHQVVAMFAYAQINQNALHQANIILADLSAYSGLEHFCREVGATVFRQTMTGIPF
jgi:hypothetical protein